MSLSGQRRILTSLLVTICIAITPPALAEARQWATGHILVKPKAGVRNQDFAAALSKAGAGERTRLHATKIEMVSVPPHAEKAMVQALSRNPHIEFAELDELVPHAAIDANDTYYNRAWHLQTLNAPQAWPRSLGTGVVVAVLDTGVDPDHPDLTGQLVPGWNAYSNNADSSDVYGHGTKVAGVVAAASNNGIGVTSLAWNAKVMPVRVSKDNGYAYFSTIASGITWAADHGADVVNISYYVSDSDTVQDAARYMRSRGGVVVSSAGNNGSILNAPDTDAIITVGATDSGDNLTSWSNYGNSVDVTAPGSSIWSTRDGGSYGSVSGTSFSSPLTAAVVALVMAADPSLTPDEIENIITGSSVDLGSPGRDRYFGHGRVDAAAAVAAAGGPAPDPQPDPDRQAPVVSITTPGGGTVSGNVTVAVSASDDTGVSSVKFYLNGALVRSDSSAPYTWSWDTTATANGQVQLLARAYDAAGNEGTSQTVTVTVYNTSSSGQDSTPPTVSITSPGGGTVSGNVTITASASDNVGVTRVKFFIDGKLVKSLNSAPYAWNWDTTGIADGPVQLFARAFDAAGNLSDSQSVTATVNNSNTGGGDTTAPSVTITSPGGGTVSGNVTVTASATDDTGVTSVRFYLNGALVRSDSSAPYTWSWDTTAMANGPVQLLARAYDAAGNMASSQTVSVTVENTNTPPEPDPEPDPDNDTTPPTVSITSPGGGTVSGLSLIHI